MGTQTALHISPRPPRKVRNLEEENSVLRREIRYARESTEITAELVVKQFIETERILRRFQEANAQRKAVLDAALQVAIIATDTTGTITVFNKGAERMLRYRPREVIGTYTPYHFHLPEEIATRTDELSRMLEKPVTTDRYFFECAGQSTSPEMEWTYVRKDRSTLPVTMSVNPLQDSDGSVSGFLCMATDITEKKRSEKALKESESNYRLLVNSIPNIVFKGYADGFIEFYDDKIEALTGYKRSDFVNKKINWFDMVLEEDKLQVKQKFQEALQADGSYIREYRIRKKNGEPVWIEAGSQIIRNEQGEVEFVTGAFLDITKRKQAEQAVHESEEKYRSLFDSGPNPIFVLDRQTMKILDANPSAEEIYRIPGEQLVGKTFTDLGSLEGEDITLAFFQNGNWPDACVDSQRARHRIKGREPLFIKLKTCPIRYRSRDAVILAITDITDNVEKDAQLFQASKMTTLGELSAGIAHELNQPLNAIKIGNEFLKKSIERGQMPSDIEIETVATEVSNQVNRASEIINRLREFGRKPDFEKDRISVNVPIRQVLGIIRQQLMLQNIEVLLDLDNDIPPILANANRLEQVVFNIITNAKDAIESTPVSSDAGKQARRITIRSFFTGEKVGFSISDTGPGIPSDKKEKIFEPFFTTKEVGKGVGLGLSIIYGIVRDFGGTIDVETELMKGTTFTLMFPPYDNTKSDA